MLQVKQQTGIAKNHSSQSSHSGGARSGCKICQLPDENTTKRRRPLYSKLWLHNMITSKLGHSSDPTFNPQPGCHMKNVTFVALKIVYMKAEKNQKK